MRILVNEKEFKGIGELKKHLRDILFSYNNNEDISKEHFEFIIECMKLTPHGIKKIGTGISKIKVQDTAYGSKGFTLYRKDGSFDDFSYKKIVPSTDRIKHTDYEKKVIMAFRDLVRPRNKAKGTHIHHEDITFNQSCGGAPRCKQRGMFAPPLLLLYKLFKINYFHLLICFFFFFVSLIFNIIFNNI